MAQLAHNAAGRESTPVAPATAATARRDQSFRHVLEEVAGSMQSEGVELDPTRQHGKPVVAGTRLPVSVVLTYLAGGYSLEQIACEFGHVTVEQLRGAVEYAAEVLDQDVGA